MNRQQRRKRARELQRQQEFNRQYGAMINERQKKIDDHQMLINLACMALAIYDLYGNMPKRVQRIAETFQRRMYEFCENDQTYEDLIKEVKDKTGIGFQWID